VRKTASLERIFAEIPKERGLYPINFLILQSLDFLKDYIFNLSVSENLLEYPQVRAFRKYLFYRLRVGDFLIGRKMNFCYNWVKG